MVQHLPALVRRDGGGEIVVEGDEPEPGVEDVAEGAGEENAAGRIEFRVSEMLDADAGADAKEDNNDAGKRSYATLARSEKPALIPQRP